MITEPEEVVSVDQLVSPNPGFISQTTGRSTTKRYKYAIVFVDQASRLGYVYLQKTNTAFETLEAKASFQQHSLEIVIVIKTYHADNGIFRSNDWQQACKDETQRLTFAGVNTHFTNRMVEKIVRDIQDLTRAELIY